MEVKTDRHSFFAVINFVVELNSEDFKLLWDAMANHYDGTVQSCTKLGGFMYGWKNSRDFAEKKGETRDIKNLESHDMQLILKSLEMDFSAAGHILAKRMWSIVREAMAYSEEINKQFINLYK